MVDIAIPNSSKKSKPVSGDFTIRFAPGQQNSNQVFNDPHDISEFIQLYTDSEITVYVDLTEWGNTYDMPTDIPYRWERVFLDGFFYPLDSGVIPVLRFYEGTQFFGNFIRIRDVNFEFFNTSQTIWEPTSFVRIETERASGFIQSGNGYFLDNTNNVDNAIQYSGGPGTGTETPNGTPVFKLKSGDTFRIYADADTRFDTNSIEGPVGSIVDFRFWNLSQLKEQPNFLGTLLKSSFLQSGPTFPEETYPGKLFQKTPENRYYMRNQTDTDWVQLSVPPTVFSNNVVAAATNMFIPYVSGSYNFEQVRPHKITVSWLWALTQTSKDFWGQVRIGGTPVGINDGTNTLVLKSQPFKAGSSPAWAQIAPGIYEIEYTPVTTGSQTVDFLFRASDNTATAYVQGAVITIKEVL